MSWYWIVLIVVGALAATSGFTFLVSQVGLFPLHLHKFTDARTMQVYRSGGRFPIGIRQSWKCSVCGKVDWYDREITPYD